MNYDALCSNLKKLMDSHGYSAKSLAEELDIMPSTVSRYLTGIRKPDLPYVVKIAEHFHVSIDWLMGYSGEKYDVLPENIQNLVQLYSIASVEDRKVIDLILAKYVHE